MLKALLLLILIVAFIASCVWAYKEPSYEPFLALFGSLAALIGYGVDSYKKSKDLHKQTQISGKDSKNYQAGGDINIR
jgi:hypothetical protein